MFDWLKRILQRLQGGIRVEPDGKGYRVNGRWCDSQKEVRFRLEELGCSESEIIRILHDLNRTKYGPGR
jgi:hypothetical protein